MAGNSSSVMPMYPRSKSILDHLQECKRENNERLKQVKNLDELVMFKLTTVADKIKEEYGKDGLEVMGLDMFQKICDPLLANHSNFKSLSKKTAMLNSKKLNPASALESSYLPFSNHDAKHNGFESGVSKNINELNLSTQLGMLPCLNNDTLLMET
jgi:vacuolar-type H+-ATPase subunit I/STV1